MPVRDAVDGSSTGIAMCQSMVFLKIAEWRLLALNGHSPL
jgi:hypothetical protein